MEDCSKALWWNRVEYAYPSSQTPEVIYNGQNRMRNMRRVVVISQIRGGLKGMKLSSKGNQAPKYGPKTTTVRAKRLFFYQVNRAVALGKTRNGQATVTIASPNQYPLVNI